MLYRLAGDGLRLLALNRFSSNANTRNSEKEKNQYTYRILAVTDGSFLFKDVERSVVMNAGDAVFLPPNHPYQIFNSKGDFSVLNLWFSFSSCTSQPIAPGVTVFEDSFNPALSEAKVDFTDAPSLNHASILTNSSPLLPLLYALEQEAERDEQDAVLEGHLLLCLLDLFRTVDREKSNIPHSDLVSYINGHATEDLTEAELGRRFSYHPAYINRLVKAETGQSFKQYLIGIRIRLARQLLSETDMSRSEIAQYLGFYDLSHFNKTLKKFQ